MNGSATNGVASTSIRVPTPAELGFSPDELRKKYAEERAKRLRPEGINQYKEVAREYAHYGVDPYVEPGFSRPAIQEEIDVAIVGGGFGGLLAAVRLQQGGVTDIRLIEAAGDFGGTWYWNRYPGAQCDIESYIYLPLLEETGYIPTEKYAYQPEIFEHVQRIGKMFGLYDRALFQTRVTAARWNARQGRWHVETDRGDVLKARFVVMSSGPMNRPHLPGIPGIETFRGRSFHTSRWDYAYTGGSTTDDLHKLTDKRVGVVGTGATGIQCIPRLARSAMQLHVFQRTPSLVDERNNKRTDPDWTKP